MPTLPSTTKGYSSQYLVADALGTHDGVVPVQMIDTLLAAAEAWIDFRAGRAWGVTSVTAEQHTLERCDGFVFLNVFPATAITAIRARYMSLTATTYTLTAQTDYELVDAAHGQLLMNTRWMENRLSIDYTVSVPVPPAITLAATQLVTSWAQPMLNGVDTKALSGIKSYSIGQDLSVTFQDVGKVVTMVAPESVCKLVDLYRVVSYIV